jgi:valyl-tRNA synthetase
MPFISEELWHAVYDGDPPAKSIALASYLAQNYQSDVSDPRAQFRMILLQDLIRVAREERKNRDIPEKESVPMIIISSSIQEFGTDSNELVQQNSDIIQRLAKISTITFADRRDTASGDLNWRSVGFTEIALVHNKQIDVAAERERLKKEIAQQEKNIANADRQLGNAGFLEKAPAHIVEGLKKQRDEAKRLLDKARGDLDALPE